MRGHESPRAFADMLRRRYVGNDKRTVNDMSVLFALVIFLVQGREEIIRNSRGENKLIAAVEHVHLVVSRINVNRNVTG